LKDLVENVHQRLGSLLFIGSEDGVNQKIKTLGIRLILTKIKPIQNQTDKE